MLDFSVNPYYDDYDPAKGYYKLLIRPGYAVQAREITQIQTMLQEQVTRFANHVFEEGSVVTDAQHVLDLDVTFIKLQDQFAGQPIVISQMDGQTVVGLTSGAVGRVIHVENKTDTDPNTLFVKMTSGTFVAGEQVVAQTTLASALLATIDPIGKSSIVSINEGVYFVDGVFVYVHRQLLILDKYTNTPSYRVGLTVVENIITEEEDETLLDPALGSPNYLAPGSHRWQIILQLQKRPLAISAAIDNNSSAKFIEFLRIQNGIRLKDINYTTYSDLEDNLATRTFDESGDYTVEPFQIDVVEHDTDLTKLYVGLEPGKAYVKGYEHRTIATEYVEVDRGRDTQEVNNYDINAQYGNYIIVTDMHGLFNPATLQQVRLLSTNIGATTGGNFTANTVGIANIRAVEYHGGTGANLQYKLYLFNFQFNTGSSIKDVKSVWTGIFSDDVNANIDMTEGVDTNNNAVLFGAQFNNLLFRTPNTAVQTMRPSGNTDTQFEVKRPFSVTFVGGIASVNVTGVNTFFGATGALSNDVIRQHYQVALTSVTNAGGTGYAAGDIVNMTVAGRSITLSGSTQTATFDIDDGAFAAIGTIVATVNLNEKGEKTKTLQNGVDTGLTLTSGRAELTRSDVYTITSIIDLGDSNNDVTSSFTLDNGQRDNFYDHGAINLKAGETVVGPFEVSYQYFSHSGSGYFSVDSYTGVIPYTDIPSYTAGNGVTYNLRDVLDFRPRRQDNSSNFVIPGSGVDLPRPNTNVSSDYIFYLPRIDKVVLRQTREFGIIRGVSALNPITPPDDDDAMTLYVLNIPAYTNSADDVAITYVDNRRYTMKDIGELDRRLNTVEYYTALSLLEKETKDLTIVDGDGIEQFKSGILVDSFSGHGIGDVVNPDYHCSIDFEQGEMRPSFTETEIEFDFNATDSVDTVVNGDIITLGHTSALFITQPLQNTTRNANPFSITPWAGTLKLTPETDNWFDTTTLPKVVTNNDGENDAWRTSSQGFGTQWNDWIVNWAGEQTVIQVASAVTDVSRDAQDVLNSQARLNIAAKYSPQAILRKVGTRVVNEAIVPFIRAQDITFSASGLKPNTRVYAFFDGEPVSAYITPAGGSIGDMLVTDGNGEASGTFSIPNDNTLRFKTGERLFRLTDSATDSLTNATTVSEHRFVARGLISTREDGITSTRPSVIRRRSVKDSVLLRDPITREQISSTNAITDAPWLDPLSQTFRVDANLFRNGVTLKSLQLYFQTKDASIPITVEIRPTVNGYPHSSLAVPFTQVTLRASQVSISADGSIPTNIEFESPVFLAPGTYAICIMTNSDRYNMFVGQKGQNVANTQRLITKQPYVDQLFLPQNIAAFNGDTDTMLMFNLNRCEFNASGTVVLNNVTPSTDIVMDTMYLLSGQLTPGQIGVTFGIKTKDESTGNMDSSFTDVIADQNNTFGSRKIIDAANANTMQIAVNFTTSDTAVSPMIDLQRMGVFAIANNINDDVTLETDPFGGSALAKYITRRVTLRDGFDANGLRVFLNAYRSSQNNIRVYYKVLAGDDSTVFDSRPWVEMPQLTQQAAISLNEQDLREFEYGVDGINYDGFADFKTFAIKVVLTSANTTDVPRITDFRGIALRS